MNTHCTQCIPQSPDITAAYPALRELLLACAADPARLTELRSLAPEYGQTEYLLPVDATGAPAILDAATLGDAGELLARYGEAAPWWQEAIWDGTPAVGPSPVLLVARWLCHLTGLRHRTIQLFIDHPTAPDVTLVQVRSLGKIEAPGAFDMPVAGHVVGVDTVASALGHELVEELGLGLEDLVDLRHVGSYEAVAPEMADRPWRNREWRVVYRCRLRAGALARVRFTDGEVAALALFAVDELRALMGAYPTRVASGLSGSLSLYA